MSQEASIDLIYFLKNYDQPFNINNSVKKLHKMKYFLKQFYQKVNI